VYVGAEDEVPVEVAPADCELPVPVGEIAVAQVVNEDTETPAPSALTPLCRPPLPVEL
jgi:hypothetical protein